MMSGKEGNISSRGRKDRLIKEEVHDPYRKRGKPVEPSLCPQCGVVFVGGRWQWLADAPASVHEETCPACQRIEDKVPAGFLTLTGGFFQAHSDEILRLVHNKVEEQKAQHPMKRLMAIEDRGSETVVISFTDMHLPRGVGEAIERAYEGELDIQYTNEGGILRVYWKR